MLISLSLGFTVMDKPDFESRTFAWLGASAKNFASVFDTAVGQIYLPVRIS